jgi:hypothetical protein
VVAAHQTASVGLQQHQQLLACVETMGCIVDEAAGDRACSSSDVTPPEHLATVQQLQQQLVQQLQQQLQQQLEHVSTAANPAAAANHSSTDVQLKALFPAAIAHKMVQLGAAVATQLATPAAAALCCANPSCSNCSKLSERELVSGKGTVCSSCRAVRVCSAECNKAYWKAGHKKACGRLKATAAAAAAAAARQQASSGVQSKSRAGGARSGRGSR